MTPRSFALSLSRRLLLFAVLWISAAPAPLGAEPTPAPLVAQSAPALPAAGEAEPPKPEELVAVTAELPGAVARGAQATLRLRVQVREHWHVNANPPSLDYLVPTAVELQPAAGIAAGRPRYPKGEERRFGFAEVPLAVYEGTFTIEVPITVAADAAEGERALSGVVRYQSCNDQLCLAPAGKPFRAVFAVRGGPAGGAAAVPGAPPQGTAAADSGGAATAVDPGAETSSGPGPGGVVFDSPAAAGAGALADNPVRRLFDEHGLLAFFGLFLIGLGLNLTPCVYPMMSVTLALFGARTETRVARRLPAAFLYMMGIAITYSALGLVAALTGTLFGSVLQSPAVLVGIAVVLAAMALSMFGLFELQLPSSMLTRLAGSGTTGMVGVFLSGVMVGLFAAPCVGPPIVALLAVVAQSGNPWFGFAAFFVLSLGLGLPYLVLGTYTGLLQKLPRSGVWMVWVKKVFGVLLLAVALFYATLALRPEWSPWVVPAALVVGGVYLGFLAREAGTSRAFVRVQRALGALAVAAGVLVAVTTPTRGPGWEPFDEVRLAEATGRGQPVILDFYADWCVPCHELDRTTFSHPEVRKLAGRFATFKVDLTRFGSPESQRLRERFGVEGVPTVLFLGPDGREVPNTRVVGFLGPREFAARTRSALSASGLAAQVTP